MTVLSDCLRYGGRACQSSLRPALFPATTRATASTSSSRLHHTDKLPPSFLTLPRLSSLNVSATPGQRQHTRALASSHRHSAGEVIHVTHVINSLVGFHAVQPSRFGNTGKVHAYVCTKLYMLQGFVQRASAMQGVLAHPLLQSFIGEVLAKYWGKLPRLATDFQVTAVTSSQTNTLLLSCLHADADRTPTAVTILGLLQSMLGGSSPILFDHLAFRTFAVS